MTGRPMTTEELQGLGVCRVDLSAALGGEQGLSRWAEELSQPSLQSAFAEDGEYANYRNIKDDEDVGFPFDAVWDALRPTLARFFVADPEELRLDDAFAIHYNEDHLDTTVAKHTDPSDVTVNVCLARTPDLEGSEVLFFGTRPLLSSPATTVDAASEEGAMGGKDFLVEARQGWATVHWGAHPHQTMALRAGQRTNVVLTYCFKDPARSGVLARTCFHCEDDSVGKIDEKDERGSSDGAGPAKEGELGAA